MEHIGKVKQEEVILEFDRRALEVGGNNSVLDAAPNPQVAFANIYRDFISKFFVRKHLNPKKECVGLMMVSNIQQV